MYLYLGSGGVGGVGGCLWQISLIQTCLCVVVGPGYVSTSPAFMRSSANHPAVRMACLPPKKRKIGPNVLEISTQFARQFVTTVTVPPSVCCVVWNHIDFFIYFCIDFFIYLCYFI